MAGTAPALMATGPEVYRVELREGRAIPRLLGVRSVATFQRPVTQGSLNKLYVVRYDGAIIYVGSTRQALASRMRYGLRADGQGGYHGYPWRALPWVELFVWCFPEEDSETVEAIEAEVVYLVRSRTGQWPGHQTEIHFHCTSERERNVAEDIFARANGEGVC